MIRLRLHAISLLLSLTVAASLAAQEPADPKVPMAGEIPALADLSSWSCDAKYRDKTTSNRWAVLICS